MRKENFAEAKAKGQIINKGGYHKPNSQGMHMHNCGCKKTTDKGAYRDVSIQMPDGDIMHFYHQTPVIIKSTLGKYWLNNGGWKTSTTKERINRYIPPGYYVRQIDFDWYLETPEGETLEFENGIVFQE